MSLRFYEIAERFHTIQNPITIEKLDAISAACWLKPEMRVLDLACGRGEMLTRWAQQYGIEGVGIDISDDFLIEARRRADERDVADRVTFLQGDAGKVLEDHPDYAGGFDVVTCIGATWIGGGTPGTLAIMNQLLREPDRGLLLVGDVYWAQSPSAEEADEIYEHIGEESRKWAHGLPAMLDMFHTAGYDLVQMTLANLDSWDAYYAAWWRSVHDWLRTHPDDPDFDALHEWIDDSQRNYLLYERETLGWGIFMLQSKLTV